MSHPSVGTKPALTTPNEAVDHGLLRAAIRDGRKLRLRYRSAAGEESERIVWPVILGFDEMHRVLIVWCESRDAFRHLRTDRIRDAAMLAERIEEGPRALRRRWSAWREHTLRAAPAPI